MKSNYKPIGNYIKEIVNRNTDLKTKKLLGINIDKFFMPSVANIIGTDLSRYKIVKPNQFACNRMHVGRDYRLPIAISKDQTEFIVSPAYNVFEITDTNLIDPDYLMMWFMRGEFDRNAWFYTDADVRGGLRWDDFCEMQVPIPSIKKQREIVSEYNVINNRVLINKRLIKKIEELILSIFKLWFVEFNFPDNANKPFKDNGGEMLWSDEYQINVPINWETVILKEFTKSTLGGDWGKDMSIGNYTDRVYCLRGTDIPTAAHGKLGNIPIRYILSKNLKNRKINSSDIVIEISGGSPTQSTGRNVYLSSHYLESLKQPLICSNFCRTVKSQKGFSEYLQSIFNYLYHTGMLFKHENSSNGVKNLALEDVLDEEFFVKPSSDVLNKFKDIYLKLNKYITVLGLELENYDKLAKILLSKIALTKE